MQLLVGTSATSWKTSIPPLLQLGQMPLRESDIGFELLPYNLDEPARTTTRARLQNSQANFFSLVRLVATHLQIRGATMLVVAPRAAYREPRTLGSGTGTMKRPPPASYSLCCCRISSAKFQGSSST